MAARNALAGTSPSRAAPRFDKQATHYADGLVLDVDKNRCIPVAEIAEKIGFGRAPVLDALRKLESEEFLTIVPQKGIMVSEMSIQDMREISDIRMALETFIMGHIAPVFSTDNAARARAEIDEQVQAARTEDQERFIASDERFHLFLSGLTHNSRMITLMQHLRNRFFTAGLYVLKRPGRMKTTIEEHVPIIDALGKNDGATASQSMLVHLNNGRTLMF